jgi:tetratricopeptide (TPR) repeat protein
MLGGSALLSPMPPAAAPPSSGPPPRPALDVPALAPEPEVGPSGQTPDVPAGHPVGFGAHDEADRSPHLGVPPAAADGGSDGPRIEVTASLPPAAFPAASAFSGDLAFSTAPPAPAPRARRRWGMLLLIAGLVLLGGLLGVGLARLEAPRTWMTRLLAGGEAERVERLLDRAAAAAELDTEAGRERAQALLEAADALAPDDGVIPAERAFVTASGATARYREADRLEAEADALDARLESWRDAVRRAQRRRRPLPPRPDAPDPGQFRRRAQELRAEARDRLEAARPWVEEAQAEAPQRLEPERALAAVLLAEGNLDALEPQLTRLERAMEAAGRADPHILVLQAAARLSPFSEPTPEDLRRAEARLREALAARPTLNRARVHLARLLLETDRPEAARAVLAPVLSGAPAHAEAQALDAEARKALEAARERKKTAAAQRAAKKAAAAKRAAKKASAAKRARPRRPKLDVDDWLRRGHRHRKRGRIEPALDAYGRAAELEPDAAEPHAGKGWCFLDLGRPRLALLSFERAVRANDRFAEAHLGLGEAHLRIGDREEAMAAYRAYLARAPEDALDRPVAERKLAELREETP